ncbi:Mycosubtilin synthase subunit C, partial [Armadillidium vulgare]
MYSIMLTQKHTLLKKYEDPKTYCTKVRLCYLRKVYICKVNNIDLIENGKLHYCYIVLLFIDISHFQIEAEDGSFISDQTIPSSSKLIAAILYTSGSTGIPKGVRIPHSAVLNRLIWQWRNLPYDADEVCCFKTTLTFVDSISEIFGPLLTSHSLIIIPKRMTTHTESLVKVLEDYRIGRLTLVPSLLRSVLIHASRINNPLPFLRLWICSGESLQADLVYSFFETFTNNQVICNFYGSTEVMGDVSVVKFSSSEEFVKGLYNNKVPI